MSLFLAACVGYVGLSALFFIFPTLLHRKRNYNHPLLNDALEKKRVLRIAHRGGSRMHMENTLEGFRKCMQTTRTDMLEMDVCFTKDGKLVVHHDSNLLRTCGVGTHIQDLEFQQLPDFLPRVVLDFAYRMHAEQVQGVRIPLLQDVFRQFPDVLMNIEIKTPSHEAIEEFRRLLQKYNREHLTIWGIRGILHQKLKQPGSTAITFFNDAAVAKLFLLYITGLLPFFPIRDDSLQLPLWTEDFLKWKLDTSQNQRKVKGFFHGLTVINWLLPPLVRHLRKRGIMTFMWVCNTKEDYQRAVDIGCEGIMTDLPQLLDSFFDEDKDKQQ